MAAPMSQKEYLKKYLSGGDNPEKKKKKKKKKEKVGMRIIEEGIDLKNVPFGYQEDDDAPTIAEVTYEEPDQKVMEEFKESNKWKKLKNDMKEDVTEMNESLTQRRKRHDSDSSSPRRQRHDSDTSPPRGQRNDSDTSPPREKRHDSDASPPRGQRHDSDSSPPKRQKHDSDTSPKRKRHDSDTSPSRRQRHDSDASPPQGQRHDSDTSPPKRQKHDSDTSPKRKRHDSDTSPPRRQRNDSDTSPQRIQRHDSDTSPPRRQRNHSDNSPPRKQKYDSDASPSRKQRYDSDESPPRKQRYDSDESPPRQKRNDSDESPPRRKRHNSDSSPRRRKVDQKSESPQLYQKHESSEDDSPPRVKENPRVERTMTTSEFLTARKKGKLKKDTPEEIAKKERNASLQQAAAEKHKNWNKGVAQIQAYKQRLASDAHEMGKAFTRTADDKDMNDHLKNVSRGEDPMLEYVAKKIVKQSNAPVFPKYQGSFPPNRFNVRPGYRWDGVDRSTGFENQWFQKQCSARATEEDAYKWSVADM